MKRLWGWLGGLWRPERVEVAWLKEQQEDLRAEVRELRRQFRAFQEREAVLNAHVLHLARNCASGAGSQIANGAGQGSIPGPWRAAAELETSGDGKGAG